MTRLAWSSKQLRFTAVKAAADDWDEREHPRDRKGRFVRKNARVRLFGGGLGTIVGFNSRTGRFRVQRDDGRAVDMLPAHITVEKDQPARDGGDRADAPVQAMTAPEPATAFTGRHRPAPTADEAGTYRRLAGTVPPDEEEELLNRAYPPGTDHHTREWIRKQIEVAKADQEYAASKGITPDELDDRRRTMLRNNLDGKPVAVRVTAASLGKIVEEGRFKTQFETNKSRGRLDPQGRADFESSAFGYPPVTPGAERPVYGYVDVDGPRPAGLGSKEAAAMSTDALSQYGDVQVVLKDSVRNRSTVTVGDSLTFQWQTLPSPLTDPQPYSLPVASGQIYSPLGKQDPLSWVPDTAEFRGKSYVEAQIHGGVSVDDIDHVLLPKAPSKKLREQLDQAGVPWRVFNNATVAAEGTPDQKRRALRQSESDLATIGAEIERVEGVRAAATPAAAQEYDKELVSLRRQRDKLSREADALRNALPDDPEPEPDPEPAPEQVAAPVPEPAPEPTAEPAGAAGGTLRPDLTGAQRNAIAGYGFDTDEAQHPLVREAAAAVRDRRPLTADQAQALADALRAQGAQEPKARARALDRAAGRLETVSAALNGIAAPHVPTQSGVEKAEPGVLVDGDLIALPGRGGTADIRRVVSAQEWYGQYRMELEAEDGTREERLVHPSTDVYLLPDVPDPVPVPPEGNRREHLVPDRLRPGDTILGPGGDEESVVSVSEWAPGRYSVVVQTDTGQTPTRTLGQSGYPAVIRVKRGPASQDQTWDSVLPDDDPTDLTAGELRVGDRAQFRNSANIPVEGMVVGIATVTHSDGSTGREVEYRTTKGDARNVYLDDNEPVTRLTEGGDGAAERIAAMRAAAQQRMATSYIAEGLQRIDRFAQTRTAKDAERYLNAPVFWDSPGSIADRVDHSIGNDIAATEAGDRSNWYRLPAQQIASVLAPNASGRDLDVLTERLMPLFQDAAVAAQRRARDRIVASIRNLPPAAQPADNAANARAVLSTLSDPNGADISPADYSRVAPVLSAVMPDLDPKAVVDPNGPTPVPDLPDGVSLADRMNAYRDAIGGEFGHKRVQRTAFTPVRLADLEQGRAPQIEQVDDGIPDRAADGGPGETAMRHLAIVRAAGRDLDAELQRRIKDDLGLPDPASDEEIAKVDERIAALKARFKQERQQAQNAFARLHGYDSHEALIDAASPTLPAAKLAGIKQLLDQASQAADKVAADTYKALIAAITEKSLLTKPAGPSHEVRAAAQRRHVLALLNEVRGTGVGGTALNYQGPKGGPKTEKDPLVTAMRWAEAGYPTDWLDKIKKRRSVIALKKVNRGYHSDSYSGTEIGLSGGYTPVTGAPSRGDVANHELGHAAERAVPGLTGAEEALIWDRTATGPIGSRVRPPATEIWKGSQEYGWKDSFPDHYTGKDYGGRDWEVFTTAKESLTSGGTYLDDDLRHWVLGVLALL